LSGRSHCISTKEKIDLKLYLVEDLKKRTMLTKTRLKEQIEKFPEEFSIDDLVERLILIEKVETGMNQSERGDIISESDLDNEVEKWFK
jgi:hypothetical protein